MTNGGEYEGLGDEDEFAAVRCYLITNGNGEYLKFATLFRTLKGIAECIYNYEEGEFAEAEFVYRTAAEPRNLVKIYITRDGPDDSWGILEARERLIDDADDVGIVCSDDWASKIAAKFGGTIEAYD
jgi:hypothetical protein